MQQAAAGSTEKQDVDETLKEAGYTMIGIIACASMILGFACAPIVMRHQFGKAMPLHDLVVLFSALNIFVLGLFVLFATIKARKFLAKS
jgi:hypothetical protein